MGNRIPSYLQTEIDSGDSERAENALRFLAEINNPFNKEERKLAVTCMIAILGICAVLGVGFYAINHYRNENHIPIHIIPRNNNDQNGYIVDQREVLAFNDEFSFVFED